MSERTFYKARPALSLDFAPGGAEPDGMDRAALPRGMDSGSRTRPSGATALRGEVRDLLALETRLHARVRFELDAGLVGQRPDARSLLLRMEPRLYAHQSALDQALHRLQGRTPVLRRALASSLGRFAHWIRPSSAPPEPSGDLCDIYTLVSATAAAYLVLVVSARALGDGQTAGLAERCADDANEFLDDIALLLPELTREAIER